VSGGEASSSGPVVPRPAPFVPKTAILSRRRAGGASLPHRHLVWLLSSFALLSVFPFYGQLNNSDENARIWMVRAIIDHHELSIDRVSREWGRVREVAASNGRLYSVKAPGMTFVGAPIYFVQRRLAGLVGIREVSRQAMTLVLRLFGVGLPLSVFLFFFARYVERITASAAARDLLVAGLGMGSMMFPYGVVYVGHALAAAMAFSAFMLLSLEPVTEPRPGRLAWAGGLVGLSVVFEYQVAFAGLVLAAYAAARHRRAALYFLMGTVPPLLFLAVYHAALFGVPWALPFRHADGADPGLASPGWTSGRAGPRPSSFAITSVLFSPSLGLFAFSPFLLVGLAGAIFLVSRSERADGTAEGLTFSGVTLSMIGSLGVTRAWRAGWCVGPFYIAVVAPFLAAGIAHLWHALRGPRLRALSMITAGLVIPSVVLNVLSGAVYPHYPEPFDNPVFDLTLPLLADGHVPYSLGWLLGLPGLWSLAPLALALMLALAVGIGGDDQRPRQWATHAAAAVLIAMACLLPLSLYGRDARPVEAGASEMVRAAWEPPAPPAREP
jgi:hypothetical protein